MEVVASLSQGRTATAQCGLFTYKSVPVIFEPPCIFELRHSELKKVYSRSNTVMLTAYVTYTFIKIFISIFVISVTTVRVLAA